MLFNQLINFYLLFLQILDKLIDFQDTSMIFLIFLSLAILVERFTLTILKFTHKCIDLTIFSTATFWSFVFFATYCFVHSWRYINICRRVVIILRLNLIFNVLFVILFFWWRKSPWYLTFWTIAVSHLSKLTIKSSFLIFMNENQILVIKSIFSLHIFNQNIFNFQKEAKQNLY